MLGDLAVDLGQELLELDRAVAAVQVELITVPSAVLNAANRLVVPWRR